MENNFNYKWKKIFASKRYNSKKGDITLTPGEQQELLDDGEKEFIKNVATTDYLLHKAVMALDDYLNAGDKEAREEASKKAKQIYEKYFGVAYRNRNDR